MSSANSHCRRATRPKGFMQKCPLQLLQHSFRAGRMDARMLVAPLMDCYAYLPLSWLFCYIISSRTGSSFCKQCGSLCCAVSCKPSLPLLPVSLQPWLSRYSSHTCFHA